MELKKPLYPSFHNPSMIRPHRSFPNEMAVIGAGSVGPDIGCYLISALPEKKICVVDIAEEALRNAEKRYHNYVQKSVAGRKLDEEQAQRILGNVIYKHDKEFPATTWTVENGILTVWNDKTRKSTQLGDFAPEILARLVLRKMVSANRALSGPAQISSIRK
jgi:3-methyladenine DNA glycosylase AlkC